MNRQTLFSADQMDRFSITLAKSHILTTNTKQTLLLNRLSVSETILLNSCKALTKKTKNISFSPAKEWLLDNFYLIQEQIHTIRNNLPKGYGRTLPKLVGTLEGYPRIYDIVLQIIEHSDGRWDLEKLNRFITSYQTITPLNLSELWATPLMLGIALIENLSSASLRIVAEENDRHLAHFWIRRLTKIAGDSKKQNIAIENIKNSNLFISSAFVAELTRGLQNAGLNILLNQIGKHIAVDESVIEELIQKENKQQAINQVTVSNCIASLRRLNEVNWRDFVETLSVVDQALRMDPTATYSQMAFETRDRYRHVIERLAKKSLCPEWEVTAKAIQLAKANQDNLTTQNKNASHVGFYLIDKGKSQLETLLNIQHSSLAKISQFSRKWALPIYLGSILFITSILVYILVSKANLNEINHLWLWILGITITIGGSQLAIAFVNLSATFLVKPHTLPRMNFAYGIPAEYRTLVVIPTMISSIENIEKLVEALEVRFLGNHVKHLHFMLLTDFNDASNEHMPNDAALLASIQKHIVALNERYAQKEQDIFFLCHRPRQWNAGEQVWMGKERKRGKLAALNNLLRGNVQKSFSLIEGKVEILAKIKYVITLDSDTQLPRESAHQLIGAMAHPLNRPRLNASKERVIEGYGILQPRIAEALPNFGPTHYVQLSGNEYGIDPYTRVVSDVYQDVFDEGSFIGKGIYDVDVFQQVLGKCFPENHILSHDLLEGCYLRSGFLSDVPLYEKSPSSYLADVQRRIRWIRGDWQLLGWLLPWVLNAENHYISNPLSSLSRWKLFDNLRRSLVSIALIVLLGLSWTVLPPSYFWLSVIVAIIILPTCVNILLEFILQPKKLLSRQQLSHASHAIYQRTMQLILYVACLPHEAWYSLNAILLTCWRMLISKQYLLEWMPSDQVNQHLNDTTIKWISSMWIGPAIALATLAILIIEGRFESLLFASPLIILWLTSPLITRELSRPSKKVESKLNSTQLRFLHRMSRKTWGFFEEFITAENYWLPPDNYQEAPIEVLARRTSPTNIGLALLANLTAYDFGYINIHQLLERTNNTLQTMTQLEKYQGHLYNWYNTKTLEPLSPRYISTVDSGNLAGHLLTLRQGLLELPDDALLHIRYIEGLKDTWDVLTTTLIKPLPRVFNHFQQILNNASVSFTSWPTALICCNELCVAAEKITLSPGIADSELNEIAEWSHKLLLQCRALQKEIKFFAQLPALTANTTLRDIATSVDITEKNIIQEAKKRIAIIDTLAQLAFSLTQMDMSFLYNSSSHLMVIGFNVDEQRRDASHYDLLSSEARLGSFVAIAQGQVLQESWFALGRMLTPNKGVPLLLSWSGSMFEYLMPLLVMPTYPGTLLDQTYHAMVNRQIAYGKQRNVPWGISESGLNAVDSKYHYLYNAFGVPGLGLKRGLEEELVIAPYASTLALMISPEAACLNLQRLAAEYATGKFGFYEAIDFTVSRLPSDCKRALVRSFMAHHQGMSLLAFSYFLNNQPMQRRFVADPLLQAALLLLQERIPTSTAASLKIPELPHSNSTSANPNSMRIFNNPDTRAPQIQLLSNGRYHLMLTQVGGGYSRWKDIAVTRWREDATCDNWGLFSYVRDVTTGQFGSAYYQPTLRPVEQFKSVFSEARAEFNIRDMLLDMHSEIVVSPEDDIELRRLRIYNRANNRRVIEFTSYGEIALAQQAADLAQPAFNNLFVETELLAVQHAILATRRPQDNQQHQPWLCHLLNVYSEQDYEMSFETDRARFIGRGHSLISPQVMLESGDLSNTSGAVLDPIIAIRCRITLEPNAFVTLDLITGIAETRLDCIALIEKYQDRHLANRIFGLAWTHGQILLHQLNISEKNSQIYARLASSIVYVNNARRADPSILASNQLGQPDLWKYSISGDLPIVLLQIEEAINIELVEQLIQAQAYCSHKGLIFDLVIINDEHTSSKETLQTQISNLITPNMTNHSGCIVLRTAEQIPSADRILFQSVAHVVLSDKYGTLKKQLKHSHTKPPHKIPGLTYV